MLQTTIFHFKKPESVEEVGITSVDISTSKQRIGARQ